MPASLPNLSSIHTMGAQFKTNIFSGASRSAFAGANRLKRIAAKTPASNVQMPAQPEKTFSPAGPNDAPLSSDAVREGRMRRQERAGVTPDVRTTQASGKTPGYQSVTRQQASGAAPSFPSSAPSRSQASGQAPSFQVNIMPSPSALAHAAPSFSSSNTQPQQFSNSKGTGGGGDTHPGFVDTSTKDNSPFPTHVHPENSSSMNMHDLSRKISTPGKPNPVTLGSRNIKGGGIASMGSQLEEGLATRPLTLPPKRKRI